jgi:hypothetical protein
MWHCSKCNDDMHPKFQASHEKLCSWLETVLGRAVEKFIESTLI